MARIACISTARVPSDTANSIQVMKACQGLASLGHAIRLFTPRWSAVGARDELAWEALAEQYGLFVPFEIVRLPSRPRFKRNDFAWTAVRRAGAWRANLIYTWTGQSAVFSLLHGLPTAFEVHDLPTGRIGPLWHRLFWRLPGSKRLLPITRALQERLETRFGAFPGSVVIAPNGVDLAQYANLPDAPTARRSLGLPERVTVLCAGHLYAGRGVDLFLGLAQRFPQGSFVWVGGRPEDVETWQAESRRAGLVNVTFTGFVSNRRLPGYQAAADVLLMPYGRAIAGSSGGNSADICSPMKMFDYLAAGRAILSSDLPVIHEVLNESTARFAPPDDLPAWANTLAALLADEDLRRRLGAQACAEAGKYAWKARAERAIAGLTAEASP